MATGFCCRHAPGHSRAAARRSGAEPACGRGCVRESGVGARLEIGVWSRIWMGGGQNEGVFAWAMRVSAGPLARSRQGLCAGGRERRGEAQPPTEHRQSSSCRAPARLAGVEQLEGSRGGFFSWTEGRETGGWERGEIAVGRERRAPACAAEGSRAEPWAACRRYYKTTTTATKLHLQDDCDTVLLFATILPQYYYSG